mmetsp:Transcript_9364/g.20823  ORF Transcript_9364/g.20823 Transcript_9364/m.20823 type:complete len:193 (-) Transcript_9364:289-867(-)
MPMSLPDSFIIILLLLFVVLNTCIEPVASLDWKWRRLVKHRKKRAREGWRRTKKGWERLDLPPDASLRIGIKHRPKHCQNKSKPGDFLSVHYNGTLYSDGRDFDSSILREEPFVFQIGRQQMNEGWEKGLLQMCIGEKRKLTVPSDMAYGEVGSFGSESTAKIKPGATIVYDIELLDILDEEKAAPHLVWGL